MSLSVFRKKSVVGLDIGHEAIRVMELDRNASGWHISHTGWIQTPEDSIKDGVVVDPQPVAAAIKQLFRENHIGAHSVSIAVGGGTVVVRVVRMPVMTEATLRKSIKFEAGRYVPTSVEDSFIEFEILGRVDENQMDVLMVAAPKDIVSSRVAACEQAGLEVESVDVEAFAAYRSIIESDSETTWHDKTIGLVDIGSSKTNISVIRNGVFTMTRSIPQGGRVLTDALKQYFKLSDEEAESGKAQLDLNDLIHDDKPQENPPLRVIQPHIDDLVREIRRSLNYYQSQQTEGDQSKQIDALVITGGGAKLAGLETYAGAKLKLPTHCMGVRGNPRFAHAGHEDGSDGTELAVVCGLAMRQHTAARSVAA